MLRVPVAVNGEIYSVSDVLAVQHPLQRIGAFDRLAIHCDNQVAADEDAVVAGNDSAA